MAVSHSQKYIVISVFFHAILLLVLVLGFDFSSSLPVIENTNKNDVISAVVLGDSVKSKILPKKMGENREQEKRLPKKLEEKIEPKVEIKKEAVALKMPEKKVITPKKQRNFFEENLLADIKKQKKIKQKQLQSQFQKTLHEQSEKSMRQQFLNEEFKLQGTQLLQSKGVVNKYKALILQAIRERWIIPNEVNKKLYCELMIRLAPGGLVLDVQITKPSGNAALDSSVRAAVFKASPLPVPADPNAFEVFRQFILKVKPENILAG